MGSRPSSTISKPQNEELPRPNPISYPPIPLTSASNSTANNNNNDTLLPSPYVNLAQGKWWCDLCSALMAIDSKESHLGGKKHAKKLRVITTTSDVDQSTIPPTSPISTSIPSLDEAWRCEVCQCSMLAKQKESHLNGAEHIKRARTLASQPAKNDCTCAICERSRAMQPFGDTWRCEVCQRLMLAKQKEVHLNGANHVKRVRILAGRPTKNQCTCAICERSRAMQPLGDTWRCEVCQRSMLVKQKEYHLNGASHVKRARILAAQTTTDKWTCVICERSMQFDQREPHLRGSRHLKEEEAKGMWYCAPCERVTQARQREEHLRGGRHLSLMSSGQPNPASSSLPPSMPGNGLWHCTVCNKTMQLDQRELHERGIEHTKKLGEWTCVPCGLTMTISSKASHEAGARHMKKIAPRPAKWTCVPCGRTMPINSKAVHEGGSAHRKVLARQESGGIIMWTCEVCNRTMSADQKSLHLGGRKHMNAVRENDPDAEVDPVAAVQEVDPVAAA